MKNQEFIDWFFLSFFFCYGFFFGVFDSDSRSRLLECPAQEELDLRIQAAQIIVRPTLDRLQQRWIDPKEKWFALSH
jgi:hypothetical protein